ncbi:hypothetical protein BaRGS_00025781 [Batillaria attramentaria]|uniref:Uncharacterized protein n=1 Tax=Batillaria attramentaria TaxID=370345 RepID=A0ABD0K713_9CAEN|nr:hypothetical protein BaRGS_030426 [Batillaria attramentaria]
MAVATDTVPCDVKVLEEILPDGTIHHKMILRRNSRSGGENDNRSNMVSEEVLEMYEQPPHLVQDFEEMEEVLPDGSKAKRKVSLSRMVHGAKTHHESFDESTGGEKVIEDYEFEEVVPGTVSAFDAGVDSDYEAEVIQKGELVSVHQSQPLIRQTVDEIEDVLPDGTRVKRKVVSKQVIHTITTRKESFDKDKGCIVHEDYSVEEVLPNTSSAFSSGFDSDYEG